VEEMTFENCDLFKRSFTTQGMGYTFNNEPEDILIKKKYRNSQLAHNMNRQPSLMKSINFKHSLTVVIDSNSEEVQAYENNFKTKNSGNIIMHKPKEILVSLHSSTEPADSTMIPLKSVKIPLGSSTTFLITKVTAREIDEDAANYLTESQRNCRLNENTDTLDVLNIYTKVSCLFECKMNYALKRCGCIPWNYPIDMENVSK